MLTVAEPLCPEARFRLALHDMVVVPQPALTPTVGSSAPFELLALTLKAPVPAIENITGMAVPPAASDWLPPLLIATVGGGGAVTVELGTVLAVRFAPSVTNTCIEVVPVWPIVGVTQIVQAVVCVPHVEGEIVTPGVPAETSEEGMSAGLLLITDNRKLPTPATVSGAATELEPPTTEAPVKALIVGNGIAFKVPTASTRPYPYVLSGSVLPSCTAPVSR